MADNKKKKKASGNSGKKKTAAKRSARGSSGVSKLRENLVPIILFALAVFILVFIIPWSDKGSIGPAIGGFFTGLFSFVAFFIPPVLFYLAWVWDNENNAVNIKKSVFAGLLILSIATLVPLINIASNGEFAYNAGEIYRTGMSAGSGGLIGSGIAVLLNHLIGHIASIIITVILIIVEIVFLFDIDVKALGLRIKDFISGKIEEAREAREERIAEEQARLAEEEAEAERERKAAKRRKTATRAPKQEEVFENEYADDDADEEDLSSIFANPEGDAIFDKFNGQNHVENVEQETIAGEIDLFEDTEEAKKFEKPKQMSDKEIAAATALAESEIQKKEEEEEEEEEANYEIPPLDLLSYDKNKKNIDVSNELRENATKLVETLRSFKVNTRIVDISRGPTITRYELIPDEGVRVHRIADLIDDISLSLAATGVRIEAPIPGKSAVGVEVPNSEDTKSIVYLRPLLEEEEFIEAKSKLTVALGTDIAGNPMYCDLAKLPHLIIAGATGMGKSVCINSMLTSIIYKAKPNEVKLILIDPKKVELAMYNGLPHLLMPVVTDPKKAAGTLNWAVSEMERRFICFEDIGVRDLDHFNEYALEANDPEIKPMPKTVIVIDELADLMMTAKKDVETSICRLAQKARAAGIHVIIGTQRPSVDVITGLIKANFPSRIAFTVASQVDSRTILDVAGAEKLIGRGDMLYAPVGSPKPIRVQGAFVDGKEVERVVSFVKEGHKVHYDDKAIKEVEKISSEVGDGSAGGTGKISGADGDNDPMLLQAIETAIEAGKISTSLLQRKMSIGYGRAAKIIDKMEEMGIVSPQVGMKPRNVLITKEQYQEMVLGKGGE